MKTFLPNHAAGAVNVFRYQVRPPHWSCSPRWPGVDQLSKVSTSLYVCGAETTCHAASSKFSAAAPVGSGLRKRQSGLKFKTCRGAVVAGRATLGPASGATQLDSAAAETKTR